MKKSTVLMISILIVLCGLFASAHVALALDAPHNTNDQSWSINCSRCHYSATSTPTWATLPQTPENTFFNNLCTDCHAPGKLTSSVYENVKTHSAVNTGSAYWGGAWTVECRTCHSPHYQQQSTNLNFAAEPGVNVLTGAVTGLNSTPSAVTSTLTDTSKNFITNQFADYLLLPNVNYPARVYRIISNTQNTFTVAGAINLNYTSVGTTYAIRYGKMVNAAISYAGGYEYGYTNPPVSAPLVKFFNATGPNSFGTGTASGMTAVCQVCHTQTLSFNNSGVQEAGTHPPSVAGRQSCMDCHTHGTGFKIGGCTGCHGTPPIDNTIGPPTGLANNNGGTGSTTAGAHRAHVITLGYACDICHEKGMPATAIPNYSIEMGFKATLNPNGGTYFTRVTLSNGYTYTAGNVLTTLTPSATGAMKCTNLYCHSNVQPPTTGSGQPTSFATPSWAGTVVCGDCHAADGVQGRRTLMSSGSHSTHVNTTTGGYSMPCSNCHQNAGANSPNHVDRVIEMNFNAPVAGTGVYNGSTTPGAGFGSCSAVYCHGNFAGGNNANSPTWGNTATGNCGTCHGATAAAPPANASHAKHASTPGYSYGCQLCHNATTTTGTTITNYANHADHNTDWSFSASDPRTNGALYKSATSGSNASVGANYGSCTNLYCHSQGTANGAPYAAPNAAATWGGNALDCTGCHGGDKSAAIKMQSGSHAAHVSTASQACGLCHSATSTTPSTITNFGNHVNKLVNVAFTSFNPGGLVAGVTSTAKTPGTTPVACSNLYCHSSGQSLTSGTSATPSYGTATWGNAASGACGTCHPVLSPVLSSGSHTLHLNTAASGANVICGTCHTGAGSGASYVSTNHVNGQIDIAVSYTAGTTPGNGYGTCSATMCHGTNSGAWGANTNTAQCTKCHGQAGTTVGAYGLNNAAPGFTSTGTNTGVDTAGLNTSNAVGAHKAHLATNAYRLPIACTECHKVPATVNDAGHIDSFLPAEVTFLYSALAVSHGTITAPNPSYTAGSMSCSNTYCHDGEYIKNGRTWSNGTGTTPAWNNGSYLTSTPTTTADCNKCHGYPPTGGHDTGSDCQLCHTHVAVGNLGFKAQGTPGIELHINGNVDVVAGGGTCSGCHLGSGDVNDYVYNNGTRAQIDQAQWGYSGHGRTTGLYDSTTNTAANFPGKAGTGDPCLYCHDSNVAHNADPDFFRLRSFASATYGKNGVCLDCHATGAPGVSVSGGATVTAASRIDKYHYGSQHASTLSGGQFCWDCHEPHGDSTSAAGPIAMFQARPVTQSTSTAGIPVTIVTTTVSFTSQTSAASYASVTGDPGTFNRVCNICHTYKATDPYKMTHYTNTTSDGHNAATKCTTCHQHSADTTYNGGAFAGSACDGCHAYPPAIGDGKPYMLVNSATPTVNQGKGGWATGSGGHVAHVNFLASLYGLTLSPLGDQFGDAKTTILCGTCHDMNTANHSTSGSGTRNINFNGSTEYQVSPNAPKYNGVTGVTTALRPKTCSNVYCHYNDSPQWQDPALQ